MTKCRIAEIGSMLVVSHSFGCWSPSECINADNSKQLCLLGNTENYNFSISVTYNPRATSNVSWTPPFIWRWVDIDILLLVNTNTLLLVTRRCIQLKWVTYCKTFQLIWKKVEFSRYLSVCSSANYGIQDTH